MGITHHAAEVILQARAAGMQLTRTITIGRQVFFVAPKVAGKMLRDYGFWPEGMTTESFLADLCRLPYFADPWLRHAGAKELDSLDASDFEGANVIHDLNDPLPAARHGQYDCVIDGGSIEHIFSPARALETYMRLVKVGGSVIIFTTANNFYGHGFYQFSPDFFYRAFSPENGFELRRLVIAEDDVLWARIGGAKLPVNIPGKAYDVLDPAKVGRRVELRNGCQISTVAHAVKTAEVELFRQPPQQSDYSRLWEASRTGASASRSSGLTRRLKAKFGSLTPEQALNIQLVWLPRVYRFLRHFIPNQGFTDERLANREFYRPTQRGKHLKSHDRIDCR